MDGRYRPFASLLVADGFVVRPGRAPLSASSLEGTDVLVIANSLEERNQSSANWRLPSYSAFDSSEIAATAAWVRKGGSLLLIADHMPFAGAAARLAAAFGIQFANGYALVGTADPRTGDYPITFRRTDGTLATHERCRV